MAPEVQAGVSPVKAFVPNEVPTLPNFAKLDFSCC